MGVKKSQIKTWIKILRLCYESATDPKEKEAYRQHIEKLQQKLREG